MFHPKNRILLASGLAAAALLGCSVETPTRARALPSLVRAGDLDLAHFAGRNDPTRASERALFERRPTESTEVVRDRQWISNGRPQENFRVTTTTRESVQR